MSDKLSGKPEEELSVAQLEEMLYRKKRKLRQKRLQRLRKEGRLVEVDGRPPPDALPPRRYRPAARPTGAMRQYAQPWQSTQNGAAVPPAVDERRKPRRRRRWQNRLLLLVEVAAVVGLFTVLFTLWQSQRELNTELAVIQESEANSLALPTPTATPVINLVVLPTGHRYNDGRSPEPVESGDIPAHLLPAMQAYQPPPVPTPGPQQPRVIQIPTIGVNDPIVQGVYDWEQLKKGVGHHIGSAMPGARGNMVLAAHNDIYGEIFRDLDQLSPGDEFTVSTELREYVYVVTEIEIVAPTEVGVMEQTDFAAATLISCYPYQINTHRIVVRAELKTNVNSAGGNDGTQR